MLHEDLRLPSVATWWCGQSAALDYTTEHLGDLVIRRAFASGGNDAVEASTLDDSGREVLLKRIRSARFDYVAQEQVRLSTAPVLMRGKLEARPVVLRAFVCATPTGYAVMPGGLTRFSGRSEETVVSMQRGGASKDTWILSDGPVSQLTLLKPTPHVIRDRALGDRGHQPGGG